MTQDHATRAQDDATGEALRQRALSSHKAARIAGALGVEGTKGIGGRWAGSKVALVDAPRAP